MDTVPAPSSRTRPPVPSVPRFDAAMELAVQLAAMRAAFHLELALVTELSGEVVASVGDACTARALAHEATQATKEGTIGDGFVLHAGRTYCEIVEIDGGILVLVVHATRPIETPAAVTRAIRAFLPEPTPPPSGFAHDDVDFGDVFAPAMTA